MRGCLVAIAAMLALCCAAAGAQPAGKDARVRPEDFAILPWGWTPGDAATLAEIRACGFNLAGFVAPESLDLVRDAGLKGIVSEASTHVGDAEAGLEQAEIDKRVRALVDRVGKHEAVFGYYLRDEPGAGAFPGLGRWADAYARIAPGALAYINLFPNYASPAQLGAPDYDAYLERFVEAVHPRFLSYDHYALMDDGSLRAGYFQNLEATRAAALRHGIPFWNIVLSNAHFHYAEPTEAGLRFQLYTTLAYGARGISYFTYLAPDSGNYRLAPIDQFGSKSPTWEMLRRVNLQIHRLAPTYLQLKSVGVFHHPNVPEGCAGIATSKLVAEIEGGDLLVGEFEGPANRPYIIIVNKDLHRSTAFSVRFKEPGAVMQVNAYTGGERPWAGENNWLAAGQGMLLYLAK
ncbi:MAG: hypothetical protein IT208_03160 [Chthonomonadales bacterium]|nr:hypothetical protein [Chthonomonadales bacterium]